jgi:hypothetical protein
MIHLSKGFMLVLIPCLLMTANSAFARSVFRCGNDLIEIGDRRFEVLQKCGEPVSKEIVGYTITQDKKRELKIEEWVYGPEHGYYYYLIFEGAILVEIESEQE